MVGGSLLCSDNHVMSHKTGINPVNSTPLCLSFHRVITQPPPPIPIHQFVFSCCGKATNQELVENAKFALGLGKWWEHNLSILIGVKQG